MCVRAYNLWHIVCKTVDKWVATWTKWIYLEATREIKANQVPLAFTWYLPDWLKQIYLWLPILDLQVFSDWYISVNSPNKDKNS